MDKGQIILFAVLIYGAIAVYIGIKGKGIDTGESYFLASRSFGWFIMVCSVTMGIFSGLAFFGSPAFGFRAGAGTSAATGFFMTGVMYPALGYKLWKLGKEKGYMTAADFLRDRYYSETYGLLVALLQAIFIIPYMTLQFVAIGNGLSVCSQHYISYNAAIIIFAIFVGAYVYLGGAKSIGWLDIFNAMLALLLPLIAAVYIINNVFDGSLVNMAQALETNYPDYMTFPGPQGLFTPANIMAYILSGNLVLIVAPHILPKFYMAKSKDTFKQMAVAGPLMYCWLAFGITLMTWIGSGIYKPTLSIADSDMLMPLIISEQLPLILAIGMLWALFAFATSTADAFGLSAATIISRDIVGRYFYKDIKDEAKKDKKTVRIGKIIVILMMPIMIVIAILKPVYIVDYAYTFASPGFAQILPAVAFGLYWKRATKAAAFLGTISGLVTLTLTLFVWKWPLGIHPVVWSLAVNFLVFWLTTIFTTPPKEIIDEFHTKFEVKTI